MSALSLRRSLVPLALMGLIFFFSSQSDLDSGLGIWDLIGRKIAHFATYALLAGLWWWALVPATPRRALPVAAAIALLYAVSDEYHQSFVENRVGSPIDVAIDAAGVALAWRLISVRYGKRG